MALVLAVFAHPDDETFICGGSLALLTSQGTKVSLICATKGEMGRRVGIPPAATRETLPLLREAELKSACRALGVKELVFLGYRDKTLEIIPMADLVDRLTKIFDREQPEAVITFHPTLGGHADHCTIGQAATDAFSRHSKERTDNPTLFYVAWPGMAASPRDYGLSESDIVEVNVGAHRKEKLAAFRAHKTQSDLNSWLWQRDDRAAERLSGKEYFILKEGSGRPFLE